MTREAWGCLKGVFYLVLINAAIFGIVALLDWLNGGPPTNPLRTGHTCVEIVNRLERYRNHTPTTDEEADLKQCSKP